MMDKPRAGMVGEGNNIVGDIEPFYGTKMMRFVLKCKCGNKVDQTNEVLQLPNIRELMSNIGCDVCGRSMKLKKLEDKSDG